MNDFIIEIENGLYTTHVLRRPNVYNILIINHDTKEIIETVSKTNFKKESSIIKKCSDYERKNIRRKSK